MLLPLCSYRTTAFLFLLLSLASCSGDPVLCRGADCTVSIQAGAFVRIDDGERIVWSRFTGKGLTPLRGMYPGSVPLAYNEAQDLIVAKSLSGDGMRLTLYRDGRTLKKVRENNYPTDEILSLCLADSGALWMLHAGSPRPGTARRFIMSHGSVALDKWENHFLTSESPQDTFGGSVIEKPIALFCSDDDDRPWVVTFLYSGDADRGILRLPSLSLLQVYLYRYDAPQHRMDPVAAITPRGRGVALPWVTPRSGRLYLFQEERLAEQSGLGFPEETPLPGITDLLFAPDRSGAARLMMIGPLREGEGFGGRIVAPR